MKAILSPKESVQIKTLLALLFGLASLIASAQTKLTPQWSAGGSYGLSNAPQFNRQGNRLMLYYGRQGLPSDSSITVYDTTSNAVMAHLCIGPYDSITSAYLSPDGNTIYYANLSNKVFAYNISTGNQTALNISEPDPIANLTTSSDGSTLAYISNSQSQSATVSVYNLTTNTQVSHFTSVSTASLGFINQNADLVLSGPTLYSVSGQLIKAVGHAGNYPVTIDTNQTRVYEDYNGVAFAYLGANLAKLWSAPAPVVDGITCYGSLGWKISVTADNSALLFAGLDSTNWYVGALSAQTGAQLPNSIVTPTGRTESNPNYLNGEFVTANPKTNQLLIGPEPTNLPEGPEQPILPINNPTAQYWSCNSATGAGTYNGAGLIGGFITDSYYQQNNYIYYTNPYLTSGPEPLATQLNSNGQSVGAVSAPLLTASGRSLGVLTQSAGQLSNTLTNSSAALSPDGKFYATQGFNPNSIEVFSSSNNILVTSISYSGNGPIQWGESGSNYVLAFGAPGSPTGVVTYKFNGATLTYATTLRGYGGFKLSLDGTKLALLTPPANSGFYSVTVHDPIKGTLLGSINPDPNAWQTISDLSFSTNNLLGVQEVLMDTSGNFSNQLRVYSLNSTTPVLAQKFSYALPAPDIYFTTEYGADGVISPDGLTAVLGDTGDSTSTDPRVQSVVKLFSIATGAPITEWDNQYAPTMNSIGALYYGPSFTFSGDSKTIYWYSTGLLVAAASSPWNLNLSSTSSSIPGGTTTTATVAVSPTSANALTVQLSSSSSSLAVPATVLIPAHQSSVSFPITTTGVSISTPATITAILGNASSSTTVNVLPTSKAVITFNPSTVNAGTSSTGTVQLDAAAGPGGLQLALLSDNASVVGVPATVTVPANATSATFTATTFEPLQSTSVMISATAGNITGSGSLNVNYFVNLTCQFSSVAVAGGTPEQLTVALSNPAPTGGLTLSLSAFNAAMAPPSVFVIPAGQTSATISIPTAQVTVNTVDTVTVSDAFGPSGAAIAVVYPASSDAHHSGAAKLSKHASR